MFFPQEKSRNKLFYDKMKSAQFRLRDRCRGHSPFGGPKTPYEQVEQILVTVGDEASEGSDILHLNCLGEALSKLYDFYSRVGYKSELSATEQEELNDLLRQGSFPDFALIELRKIIAHLCETGEIMWSKINSIYEIFKPTEKTIA